LPKVWLSSTVGFESMHASELVVGCNGRVTIHTLVCAPWLLLIGPF
jgi:hypothetical protein